MYRWNKLGNCVDSSLLFPGYPPAAALWMYFFVCLKGEFSESYLYAAQNMLVFILLLSIYKKIEWHCWKKALLFGGVSLLFPLIFYEDFWSSIYIDGVLGIWMVYILNVHFLEKENAKFKILQISLAFATYPLVKASGSGLAFLAVIILAIDMLICAEKRDKWKTNIGILLIYIMCILVGAQSWSWHLERTGTKQNWNTSNISIGNVIELINGHAEEYQYGTVRYFIQIFIHGRGEEKSVFYWVLIILFFLIFMYVSKIWCRKQLLCLGGGLVFCIVIYAVYLLMLYCFTFGAYEGQALASYERYMGSILLGIFGFIICISVSECSKITEKAVLVMILCLMVPINSIKMYTIDLYNIKHGILENRLPYEHMKEFADFMDWNKDKVYLIDQGHTGGGAHLVGGYNALPVIVGPSWGWSLGTPRFDADVWTVDYSLTEWENILRQDEYTFVYVFHQDEQFVEDYGDIFEEPDEMEDRILYRVTEDRGKVLLRQYKKY